MASSTLPENLFLEEKEEMASPEQSETTAFTNWRYKHYFTFIERKGMNIHVKCTLCDGGKRLSTSVRSNSNLSKHLSAAHAIASTKLVAKNTNTDDDDDDAATDGHGATPSKQQKLDFTPPQKLEMASPEHSENMTFANWRYKHYFTFIERKGKNVHVMCTLCDGEKRLSTSFQSNSNLRKHLSVAHASTKLVAKNTNTDDDAATDGHGATPPKQQKLDFTPPQKRVNLTISREEMASPEQSENRTFANWRYKHYFSFIERKGNNVHVTCTLCAGGKRLSTSFQSNSNLRKHLSTAHASTKLVAKNTDDDTATDGHGATPSKQQKLDFTPPLTQTELNSMRDRKRSRPEMTEYHNGLLEAKDEDEYFLLSLVPACRRMTPRNKAQFKIKIMQLVAEYEFEPQASSVDSDTENP